MKNFTENVWVMFLAAFVTVLVVAFLCIVMMGAMVGDMFNNYLDHKYPVPSTTPVAIERKV